MSKYLLDKAGALALFAILLAYAPNARAGQDVHGDTFVSGTSFEMLNRDVFNPDLSDDGTVETGLFLWRGDSSVELGIVTAYEEGDAYDYAAHGLERNAYLSGEASGECGTTNYLSLCAEGALERSIFARADPADSFSNVLVRTASRDSIYCDLLTRFTAGESTPEYDSDARLVVWARLLETDEGDLYTNLMVTAGCYTNGFTKTLPRDYVLDFPLDLTQWYRLTIRAHGDVSAQSAGLAGFSIYIDGEPVRAVADEYAISDRMRPSAFSAEARALYDDRRLFPGLTQPGNNLALSISGFTFTGNGEIDDVSFSSSDPGYARTEAAFTLNWDAGVTSFKYTLDGGLTTNEVASGTTARSRALLIGDAPAAGLTLKVWDVAYGTDFEPGVWRATNGAYLTNETATAGEFVYDGTTSNPIATVASSRDVVAVGEGGFSTFAEAISYLDTDPRFTNATKTIVLSTNYVIAVKSKDYGVLTAQNPEGDYVLDLAGHTLKGAGRSATVLVKCRSFRIIDSGDEDGYKTGCIEPVQAYTNASPNLNTAINVYPQSNKGVIVKPKLTIEGGTIDGWVRNDGWRSRTAEPLTGEVYVEGGSFISTNGATFYLESCVTNTHIHFVYRDNHWASCGATNAVIWTGLGDGRSWTDVNNWKSLQLPTATETALFPSRAAGAAPWTVDVGANQMTTASLWLEGDIRLSGTNSFAGVSLTGGGEGRICGDARLDFEGVQPGRLAQTMLRDDFGGTVWLKDVGYAGTPVIMSYLEDWGTTNSTVVFNGVNGYVMDTRTHSIEYDLVLLDHVYANGGVLTTNLAWKNDSGYTGSTLAFKGSLSGDGSLSCGANLRTIGQLIKFADVKSYRGKFDIKGKRVLIGVETLSSSRAGVILFGDGAVVPLDLGWTCRYAVFDESLNVLGETNGVLVTCTSAAPDISSCTNVFLNCLTEPPVKLVRNGKNPCRVIVRWNPPTVEADAEGGGLASTAAAVPTVAMATSARTLAAAANDDYAAASLRAISQAKTEAAVQVAVQVADATVEVGSETVVITISNTSPDLLYGVQYRASLDSPWEDPVSWFLATDSTVTIECDRISDSGFYRVVVKGGGGQ